jgi:internalin A
MSFLVKLKQKWRMIFVKKTMRFVALILSVAILALSFAGCEGGDNSYSPEDQVKWVSEDFKDALFAAAENNGVWKLGSDSNRIYIEFSDQTTYGDLAEVEIIHIDFKKVAEFDLRDIKKFPSLKYLNISNSENLDLSPIAGLTNLESLSLYSCKELSDLSPLAELTNLEELHLDYCTGVPDLSPLAELTNLELLSLISCEEISDLSLLSGLTNLEELLLFSCTEVSDLSPIAGLTNLEVLAISNTGVSDLSPLANMTKLEDFFAWNTNVTDWSPVAHVPNVVK